jgi:hypothetical protein
MALTDPGIRALMPKATSYSRTNERGFVLEVFPTGGMLTMVAQGLSPVVQKRLAKQGAAPDTTLAEFGVRPPRAEACDLHGACLEPRGDDIRRSTPGADSPPDRISAAIPHAVAARNSPGRIV